MVTEERGSPNLWHQELRNWSKRMGYNSGDVPLRARKIAEKEINAKKALNRLKKATMEKSAEVTSLYVGLICAGETPINLIQNGMRYLGAPPTLDKHFLR